ncbi:TIGR01212 family radical SAM protein [Clostridium cochlearium]|uniref:Fe-S oxidoreductase n=1 Tax=Clostridium cochlearium TaxID=1494 RepID=A0A240B457_CLOCO|nr:TIGR01212 family radical SAM protein [Clostridium cochlearium]MBE6065572.1 TIGR01212 family radical SAM protein [Clostridium cochlearium]MBU5270039.1 TIGR01212 family radical SAM protein [Clostridium cochlearium]MCG4579241.1 TIGR01212 family radical SAM protein [Clostridium cochlearium]MDU1442916.1 TIGR01212 family radical SAM protein [Clostridium cochlearium]NMA57728.1 TIGR01212 family radical SAM protein [Clostridium cochlearium]
MIMNWGDKRYYTLNYFLRKKFGEKVFKISLDAGFSCPNRDGTISSGGCVFCSKRGSGDFAGDRNFSIPSQFEEIKLMMKKKWKGDKYIAYFQAYTNTYAPVKILREKYEEALRQKGVVGLAIATRPDCLDEEILNLLSEINKKTYLWVELGLQTANDNIAKIINRGYELSVFEKALKELRSRDIDVVVHSILGLPGETKEDMLNTIEYLSHKDIQGIKIHLLHLMKETPLVNMYKKGELKFLTQEEYIDIVCESIAIIRSNIVIHRLTGDAPRNLLIGPKWSLKKWEVLNSIDRELINRNIYQGIRYKK